MPDTQSTPTTSRIAKAMARAGLCSRRQAEEWVVDGRVSVNGKTIRTAAFNVTDTDKIEVDGKLMAARSGTRLWLYHKPTGLVVTESDPEGRRTIFDELEKSGLPRVMTIGRLDINTEGLLLLTNDGGLKRVLELPATGWLRRYRVRAHGRVTQEQLDTLQKGLEFEGIKYGPIEAALERVQGANVWLTLALREGKNREVKNVLGALGLVVNRLIRTSYGPFQLGDVPPGAVTVVRARVLRDQLGKKLAEEAGVDFDSPLPDDSDPVVLAQNPNARLRKTTNAGVEGAPKPFGRTGAPKPAGDKKVRKNAPERRGNFAPFQRTPREEKPIEKRIVHFSDGRESVEFELKAKRKQQEGEPEKRFDRDAPRPHRPNGDGPRAKRVGEDRSPTARPSGPRPHRANGDGPRPQRPSGDRPSRDDAPSRSGPPRGGKPGARPRNDTNRRPRADGPSRSGPPRGGKPSERPSARPSAKPAGARPTGARPTGGPSRGKPTGSRPTGGRPTGGRPSAPRSGPPRGRGPK